MKRSPRVGYQMTAGERRLERSDRPSLDLSWVESVDPEIEAHLLPKKRAILRAIREYAREMQIWHSTRRAVSERPTSTWTTRRRSNELQMTSRRMQ